MDLLGDIGLNDQLTSTREENAILSAKVRNLTSAIDLLQIENQSLRAEVETYRSQQIQSPTSTTTNSTTPKTETSSTTPPPTDAFVRSGNGIYCDTAEVTLRNPHANSNPLCCALHPTDDAILATGGADRYLRVMRWGAALAPTPHAAEDVVKTAPGVRFDAPVICTAFAPSQPIVAVGVMDGSVRLVRYDDEEVRSLTNASLKHEKYVKGVSWSQFDSLLATASADGSLYLAKVGKNEEEMEIVEKLQFDGAVESLCFLNGGKTLCCYVRGTPYLSYFHLDDGMKQTKHTLNDSSIKAYDGHVSFSVMSLVPSPQDGGKYLAAATDTSRNIILESGTSRQIRNLYGHQNDGYSQPKIAWSSNGQYLMGNTQDDSSVCVWDISSSSIVKRLEGHSGQIRDMCGSSAGSDTLVTVSYDKTAKVWLRSF